MEKILRHLCKDPILARVLDRITLEKIMPSDDFFSDLCESIVNQQLSEKAGATIWKRFMELFSTFHPRAVLSKSDEQLRSAGVSRSKVKYIKNVAVYAIDNDLKKFHGMSDTQVIGELTKIKGVGRWTAEMFLMFSLAREDVFSSSDVGLQRAIRNLYGERKMEKIIALWSPYRTYACRVLWKSLNI